MTIDREIRLDLDRTRRIGMPEAIYCQGKTTDQCVAAVRELLSQEAAGDAVVATMALSALSKRPPGGGPSTVNLSVSVQNGKLSLGPIPLMEMPVIDWGFAPEAPDAPTEQEPPRDYKNGPTIY